MKNITKKNYKLKGIWFYGLAGCGKSFASKCIKNLINKSIIIDGDDVRKNISFDLGYDLKSRKIQIRRLLGIGKIIKNAHSNSCFCVNLR